LPRLFADGAERETELLEYAYAALTGYRAFLAQQELTILAVEEFIRTAGPRPVRGVPGGSVIFSGRLDAVASRTSAPVPVYLDIKTRLGTADDLAAALSTYVYSLLVGYQYGVDGGVEVIHLAPNSGDWVAVTLDVEQLEQGAQACRDMVRQVLAAEYPATRCRCCPWCDAADDCPALRQAASNGIWAGAF
jgi:hypothetical protein